MSRNILRCAAAITALLLLPQAALACTAGAKCLTAPETTSIPEYVPGDVLPRGKYQMLLNSEYYGLPPNQAGTWYFRVDHRVMRVRPDTLEIVEDVTHLANRAF